MKRKRTRGVGLERGESASCIGPKRDLGERHGIVMLGGYTLACVLIEGDTDEHPQLRSGPRRRCVLMPQQ